MLAKSGPLIPQPGPSIHKPKNLGEGADPRPSNRPAEGLGAGKDGYQDKNETGRRAEGEVAGDIWRTETRTLILTTRHRDVTERQN